MLGSTLTPTEGSRWHNCGAGSYARISARARSRRGPSVARKRLCGFRFRVALPQEVNVAVLRFSNTLSGSVSALSLRKSPSGTAGTSIRIQAQGFRQRHSLKVVVAVGAVVAACLHAALLETASRCRRGTGRCGPASRAVPCHRAPRALRALLSSRTDSRGGTCWCAQKEACWSVSFFPIVTPSALKFV